MPMPDIEQEFVIHAPPDRVYTAIATPQGMDCWWTMTAGGEPVENAVYALGFGPRFDWRGRVTRAVPGSAFELVITVADSDWTGTRVTFELAPTGRDATRVRFSHTGWPVANQHWRISCYCWALYLRLLRRYVETGEVVPYPKRLDA